MSTYFKTTKKHFSHFIQTLCNARQPKALTVIGSDVAFWYRIRTELTANNLAQAAKLLEKELDVQHHFELPIKDANGVAESSTRLLSLLETPDETSVKWWMEIAVFWSELGASSIASAAVGRARECVQRDKNLKWTDFTKLSFSDQMKSVCDDVSTPNLNGQFNEILYDSDEKKLERLLLLFGHGSSDRIVQKIERAKKNGDLIDLILIITSLSPNLAESIEFDFLVREWYFAGELRAAIEQFFGNVNNEKRFCWTERHIGPLIFAGKSLRQLGDHASALACFRLAWWLFSDEEKEESEKAKNTDQETLDEVKSALRDLDWAGPQLDSDIGLISSPTQPTAIGSWFTRNGLSSRFLRFMGNYDWEPAPQTSIQTVRFLKILADRYGWFPASATGIVHRIRLRAFPLQNLAAPSTPALVSYTSPATSHHDGVKLRAIEPIKRYPEVNPPRGLRNQLVSNVGSAKFEIGFTTDFPVRAAIVRAKPGAPLWLGGEFVTDEFVPKIIQQLGGQGKTTIHLTNRKYSGPPVRGFDRTLDISPGSKAHPDTRDLLIRTAISPELRKWLRSALNRLLPKCYAPQWPICIDAVIRQMGDTDFWEWLERANANERIRQSIKLVNETAGIKVNSPRQLRRFTVLVEHITNLISRLLTATCANWVSQKITQRTEGAKQLITVILAQNDPVVASLLAIAILGTLWEAADQFVATDSQAGQTNSDEFEIKIRKRNSASTEAVDQVLRKARNPNVIGSSNETNARKSPWISQDVISSVKGNSLEFIFSGDFGVELEQIVEGFRPGNPGFEKTWILATNPLDVVVGNTQLAEMFRSVVVGPLTVEQRRLLSVSAGYLTPESKSETDTASLPEIYQINMENECVKSQRVVIWPAS